MIGNLYLLRTWQIIELLDNYHKMVYEMISPYLTLEEKIWLKDTVN